MHPAPSGPAVDIAIAYTRANPDVVHWSSGDALRPVALNVGENDVSYVAFSRTHRGLDVVGGDFVIAVASDGAVLNANVAQTAPVAVAAITPRVGRSTAQAKADGRIHRIRASRTEPPKVSGQRLVILAKDGASALAWETRTSGHTAAGASLLTVYVDADSGAVLHQQENVHSAEGTADTAHSGKVKIHTRRTTGGFVSQDPVKPHVHCANYNPTLSKRFLFVDADNKWGNASGSDTLTACAEALYVQQVQMSMVSNWLRRNGIDGTGDGFPVHVGWGVHGNARFISDEDGERVEIGHDDDGAWLTSLDIVGHELGHALDLYTPSSGGTFSSPDTQEFIADVFGTATEAYARNTTDRPDYIIGEQVNLGGPVRVMYNPSAEDHPRCYRPNLSATVGEHAAAGPGNLWFYLLAEGSNPTNGQPTASTCNGSRLTGVGITAATRIVYNAMLQKTSGTGYPQYRRYTLLAARNMYKGDCTIFNKVKAAWDAVRVPAGASEPRCVTLRPVANKSGLAGSAVRYAMSATGGSGYQWSASGLPTGTKIGSTGVISGRPTKTGTFRVTVRVKDATGASAATSFTWVLTAPPCWGQRVINPGFESGKVGWTARTGVVNRDPGYRARSGVWKAKLNGRGKLFHDSIYQRVTKIPAGCTATVTFYLWVRTKETADRTVDKLTVKIDGTTKAVYSNRHRSAGYVRKTFTVRTAGNSLLVQFLGYENGSRATSFTIDDVTVTLKPR